MNPLRASSKLILAFTKLHVRLLPFTVHSATSVYGIQLPSTVYNFRQHLLYHNTSFIAFSMK